MLVPLFGVEYSSDLRNHVVTIKRFQEARAAYRWKDKVASDLLIRELYTRPATFKLSGPKADLALYEHKRTYAAGRTGWPSKEEFLFKQIKAACKRCPDTLQELQDQLSAKTTIQLEYEKPLFG